jgi:23S rRNA pseudouridine2605 synthase
MKGIRIDNVFYRCKQAVELNSHRMRIVLVEGKNREIRRVFEDRQVGIRSLMRIRIGSVGVGELQFGQFRELTAQEVKTLLSLCHNEGKKFKSASFQEY